MSAQPAVLPRPEHDLIRRRTPARLRPAGHTARPGAARRFVERPRLTGALLDESRPVTVLVAPAGYGKSTLLAEWRARDARPFAQVALTRRDDDPAVLVASIANALCEVQPLPVEAVAGAVTAADLTSLLSSMRPAVVVLDDVHVLRSGGARDVICELARSMPPRCTLALASRTDPPLPLGRLRAHDDVVELRTGALAMTRSESIEMLRRAAVTLSREQCDRLLDLTAGWPAALQLAARALAAQDDTAAAVAAFAGDDSIVRDYVVEEVLAGLDADERDFLRRAAVLEHLSGAVCDAVLERRDSATMLRDLARGNALVVALGRSEEAFRLHPLFAQALAAELRLTDPGGAAELHRRASAWYATQGEPEHAIEHALRAGDRDALGKLLAERAPALVATGREDLVDCWLRRLNARDVVTHAPLALAAAITSLARGERSVAERFTAVAAKGRAPEAAILDAMLAPAGAAAMACQAAAGGDRVPDDSAWRPFAALVHGSGLLLSGDADGAREQLADGARRAVFDAPLVRSLCLAELALAALDAGEADEAAALAAQARRALARCADAECPLGALSFAACALVLGERGQLDAARLDADEAARRLALLPEPQPWYAATTLATLARAELRLSDVARARCLLGQASRLLRQVADAATLRAWIDDAWARADDYAAGPVACPSALTRAELRVLRFLPSHLSFREIATRLHVSANTVKTQAHAVYRKLDASSRSEAVAHARAIGLIEGEIIRSG